MPTPCGVAEDQLEAYVSGCLSAADRERLDLHVSACDACATAVRRSAGAIRALGALAEPRCPAHVIASAEQAAKSDRPAAVAKRSVLAIALAASIALAWFSLPPRRPSEPVIITSLDAAEAKLVLAELRDTLRTRAQNVQQTVYDQSVANPVRRVVEPLAASQLGVWGKRAAGLFGGPAASSNDAT